MSATSSAEVEALQRLVLHNPVTLNLLGPGAAAGEGGHEGGAQGDGASLAQGSGAWG